MPEKVHVIGDYRIVGHMGEGTFSEVLKCQSLIDGRLYACKRMKQTYDSMEQVNSLREIQALRRLNPHPNIIALTEVIFDRHSGTLSLICELMDMNIYELIKDRRSYLPESRVKLYMYQLCKAIYHMHRNGIFHRDVKPENILIKDGILKLADFGSCKSMYSKQPFTEYISTRWYRAPECLLTDGHYGYKMDMWSLGCVLFEIMSLRPLFPGSNELDQISKIHDILGSPSPQILDKFRKIQSRSMEFNFPYKPVTGVYPLLKHGSRQCIDLITKLCIYDPENRISAKDALRHPYFKELRDAERKAKQRSKAPSIQSSQQSSSKFILSPKRQPQQQRVQHKHARAKQKQDDHLISIRPKQFYMPFVASNISLPRITGKPSFHGHQSHYSSGLSSGLPPSLTHHHTVKHAPPHLSTFPPILLGEQPSGKPSLYPSTHHPHVVHSHLPSLPKLPYNSSTIRTNLH